MEELDKDGVRVMTYINPMVADVSCGKHPKANYTRNMYHEASVKGYLVKDKDGQTPVVPYHNDKTCDLPTGLVDLTNPDAVAWYKDIIRVNMINDGHSGWMHDFGEALPIDATLHDKQISSVEYHNRYPDDWAALGKHAVEESNHTGSEDYYYDYYDDYDDYDYHDENYYYHCYHCYYHYHDYYH